MNVTLLLVVALLFLPALIYCATRRPRWPFFVGLVAGLVVGAISGLIIAVLLIVISDAMHPGAIAQMGGAAVYAPMVLGLGGGGCLGMWLGIVLAGRTQARNRRLGLRMPFGTALLGRAWTALPARSVRGKTLTVLGLILIAAMAFVWWQKGPLLASAARRGDMTIARALLGIGADATEALDRAVEKDDIKMAELLIAHGAVVDAPNQLGSPLFRAVDKGHVKMAELLVRHGANVNTTASYLYGEPTLSVAAKAARADLVELLVANGADVKAADTMGFTALHWAADRGDVKTAQILLAHGATVDARTGMWYTPLHRAASYRRALGMVQLLLDSGADANAAEHEWGGTPLHSGVRSGSPEIVALLLQRGAKTNTRSMSGFTPLHLAATEGRADIATMLLAAGAPVGARDKQGRTALQWALKEGNQNVVAVLEAHGATN